MLGAHVRALLFQMTLHCMAWPVPVAMRYVCFYASLIGQLIKLIKLGRPLQSAKRQHYKIPALCYTVHSEE